MMVNQVQQPHLKNHLADSHFGLLKIFIVCALGSVISFLWWWLSPQRYQGLMLIKVAQLGISNYLGISQTHNLEEPQDIIARLKIPSSFNTSVLNACGYQDDAAGRLQLAQLIKARVPRQTLSLLEIRIQLYSTDQTKNCLAAIFNLVSERQDLILKAEKQSMLSIYPISNIKKTNLVSPIFVGPRPVRPNLLSCLVLGLAISCVCLFLFPLVLGGPCEIPIWFPFKKPTKSPPL